MFSLKGFTVRIASFNPRAEKHGDDNKLAADIKIECSVSNDQLNHFDPKMRDFLFRKAEAGEQQDLIDGENALVALRLPKLGPLSWDEEFPGYRVEFPAGLGLLESLALEDVTVRKFKFEPIEGGSCSVTFSIVCHPDAEEAGELCALIQKDVEIVLTPPTRQEVQQEFAEAA